jgi:hypothetical protein
MLPMDAASVQREFEVEPAVLADVLADVTTFYETAGFAVERDGQRLELVKRLAIARFELVVELREDEEAALAYEQIDGPFATMRTRYLVEETDAGSRLTIETTFEAPASGFGSFINGALIERQRGTELDAMAERIDEDSGSTS